MSNTLTSKVSGRMSSRGWAIALGIGAIALAAILLVVYLDRYRSQVSGENAPTPVLQANRLIPAGTPGSLVASQGMYTSTTLPQKEVVVGGIEDPAYLSGRAAVADIFPGSQLTAEAFAASDTASVDSQITGTQRAISISIDGVRGSSSQILPGDNVDVYLAVGGTLKLFKPNVKILTTPTVPGPAGGGNLIIQIDTAEAAKWMFANDNAQFWFAIRPVVGAKPTKPSQATASTLLR